METGLSGRIKQALTCKNHFLIQLGQYPPQNLDFSARVLTRGCWINSSMADTMMLPNWAFKGHTPWWPSYASVPPEVKEDFITQHAIKCTSCCRETSKIRVAQCPSSELGGFLQFLRKRHTLGLKKCFRIKAGRCQKIIKVDQMFSHALQKSLLLYHEKTCDKKGVFLFKIFKEMSIINHEWSM